jgi:Terpene synthase family 2, C-terminal metal binding
VLDARTYARLRYPFPTLVNPLAASIQEHTDRAWIDGEWAGFVSPAVAKKFKAVRTGYMTSYFFPMATWDRLVPVARMMLFSLYQDDIHEGADPDRLRRLRQRTIAVAHGEITARQADVMLAPQIEKIRHEALQFIPAESVARWAADLDLYFDGLIAESTHLHNGTYPTLEQYKIIREKALMIHPFLALKEIETGVVLPDEIHEHPAVRRLKSLAVRLPGWLNEFQSYDKDTNAGMGAVNLINVLANEYDISVADARERAFGIHDEELAEFVRLQAELPDFGEWHDAVTNHVHHLSFVISGWRGVDRVIHRYDPEDFVDPAQLRATAPL